MSATEIIQTRISRRLGIEIDAAAKRAGKTRSAIMREAAEQFLSDSRMIEQMKKTQAEIIQKQEAQAAALEIIGLQTADILQLIREA